MTFEGTPVDWGVAALPRERRLYRTLRAFDWYIIPPSSAMFRREVVEAVGGFQNRGDRMTSTSTFACHVSTKAGSTTMRPSRATGATAPALRATGPPCSAACARRTCGRCPSSGVTPACRKHGKNGRGKLTEIFRDCLAENLRDRLERAEWLGAARTACLLLRESPSRLAAEAAERGSRATSRPPGARVVPRGFGRRREA